MVKARENLIPAHTPHSTGTCVPQHQAAILQPTFQRSQAARWRKQSITSDLWATPHTLCISADEICFIFGDLTPSVKSLKNSPVARDLTIALQKKSVSIRLLTPTVHTHRIALHIVKLEPRIGSVPRPLYHSRNRPRAVKTPSPGRRVHINPQPISPCGPAHEFTEQFAG